MPILTISIHDTVLILQIHFLHVLLTKIITTLSKLHLKILTRTRILSQKRKLNRAKLIGITLQMRKRVEKDMNPDLRQNFHRPGNANPPVFGGHHAICYGIFSKNLKKSMESVVNNTSFPFVGL